MRQVIRWSVGACCLTLLSACSRNDSEEVAKLKAELAAAKAELANAKAAPGKSSGNRNVTLETFNKIQTGMSYDDVQGLFGDAGQESWVRTAPPPGSGGYGRGKQERAAEQAGPAPRIEVNLEQNKVTNKRATNLK